MSWRIAADLREMFTEIAATDGTKTVLGRAVNRRDQLLVGFTEALSQLPADFNRAEASLFLTTDLDRVALREHWGSPTAFVTTEGFENVFELGTQQRQNTFGFNAWRAPSLITRDLSFGITERTLADGGIATKIDEKEIEFLLSKLDIAGVKTVAICFLHSKKNPRHEDQVAAHLREKGYQVTCSHNFDGNEVERARQACEQAFTAPGRIQFVDEIEKLGFAKERIFLKTEKPLFVGQSNESLFMEFLEDRIRLHLPGEPIRELTVNPLSQVTLDEGGLVHVGPQVIDSEPGPVFFGKGLQLCLLDALALVFKLAPQQLPKLKADAGRATKLWAPIAKQLRLDLETCAKKYIQIAIHALALEIGRVVPRPVLEKNVLVVSGWLGQLMAPALARQLGVRRLRFSKNAANYPVAALFDSEIESIESVFGTLNFEGASAFAEGIIHEL